MLSGISCDEVVNKLCEKANAMLVEKFYSSIDCEVKERASMAAAFVVCCLGIFCEPFGTPWEHLDALWCEQTMRASQAC